MTVAESQDWVDWAAPCLLGSLPNRDDFIAHVLEDLAHAAPLERASSPELWAAT